MRIMKKKEVLGIITARGGSKSIPKKSIYKCAGKPLLYYTIKAAEKAKLITRLIISTDDEEIAMIAKKYGVEVPFMRPKKLAGDKSPDIDLFKHALIKLKKEEGYNPDVVVHLRPTTPLKSSNDIDKGIKLILRDRNCHSVRSVCLPNHSPFKMYHLKKGKKYLIPIMREVYPNLFKKIPEAYNLPRQILPKTWRHSGYIDIVRPEIILNNSMSGTKILPLYFESWRDVDIDTMNDLKYAEVIIKELRRKGEDI